MKVINKNNKIKLSELKEIAKNMFDNLVKAVIDVEKEIMVIGGELNTDEEALLLEMGSKQENLWGINIYTDEKEERFIDFDSIINIRASFGNKTREVENPEIKERIKKL